MTGDLPGMILGVGKSKAYVPSSKKPFPAIHIFIRPAKPKIGRLMRYLSRDSGGASYRTSTSYYKGDCFQIQLVQAP
jgi:hypothetical protein